MEEIKEKHEQSASKEEPKAKGENEEMKQAEQIKALETKLAASEKEAADWKNKYYMEYADLQNLRKSLEEDHREALRYRSEGFLENLFPALDGFYLALSANPNSPEAKNYQQGFVYIYKQIQNALAQEGVSEIEPKVGERFDATSMNAVDTVDGDETNDGHVAAVCLKGYRLHEKLIRPANVKVYRKAKASESKEEAKKA